jgi:hypothetical protein
MTLQGKWHQLLVTIPLSGNRTDLNRSIKYSELKQVCGLLNWIVTTNFYELAENLIDMLLSGVSQLTEVSCWYVKSHEFLVRSGDLDVTD